GHERRQQRLTVCLLGTSAYAYDLRVLIRLRLAQPPQHVLGPDRPLSVVAVVVRAVHPAMLVEVLGDLDLERFFARCVSCFHSLHAAFRSVSSFICLCTTSVICDA